MPPRPTPVALLLAISAALAAGAAAGEPPPIVVSGTVVHGAEPVAEAAVSVVQSEAFWGVDVRRVARGVTAADGSFRVAVPWAGELTSHTWSIVVEAPGLAPGIVELEEEVGRLRPGDWMAVGGIALTTGCAIAGVVAAISGEEAERKGAGGEAEPEGAGEEAEPVEAAEVVLWREGLLRAWRAVSDDAGQFRVTGLIPGDYVLGAAHPGWAARRRELVIDCAAAVTQLEPVRLVAPTEMQIQVLLEDGRPAAGVSFSSAPLSPAPPSSRGAAEDWLTPTSGRADPAGRFSVGVGLADSPWQIDLWFPGWVTQRARFHRPRPVPAEPMLFTLSTPHRIEGRVHDLLGDEIEAAQVEVVVDARQAVAATAPPVVQVATDAEGRFDSGPLEAGAYVLSVAAPGYVTAERHEVVPSDAGQPTRVTVELELENRVTGHFEVVSFDGAPVAGAEVAVQSYDLESIWIPSCHTAPDGRCAIAGIPADQPARITASHAAYDNAHDLVARVDPDAVATLMFDAPHWSLVTVRGRVVHAEDGEALGGARIAVTEPLVHAGYARTTNAHRDGTFALYGVPEGAYALEVSAPLLATRVTGLKVVDGIEPLVVRLSAGATVTGELLGAAAQVEAPGSGYVTIERAADHIPPGPCDREIIVLGPEGFPSPAEGVVEGAIYRVERLPPGRWVVNAWLARRHWSGEVRVEEEDELLRVDLEPEIDCEPVDSSAGLEAVNQPDLARVDAETDRGPRTFELEYSLVHANGIPLQDCLRLELVDLQGLEVADSFCSDAGGVWSGLPRGRFALRLGWMGREETWPVTIPGPSRRFVVAPGGDLTLRVLDAELAYSVTADWRRAVRVELTPIGHGDEEAPIVSRGRVDFFGLPVGWWQVEVHGPAGGQWRELVEIQDGGTHTLILR